MSFHLPRALLLLLLLLLLSCSSNAPAATSVPTSEPGPTFAAIGDSYASGVGSGPMGECGRSEIGWVGALAALRGEQHVNLACAGVGVASLPGQLALLPPSVTHLGVSISGNDAGVAAIRQACVTGDCTAAIEEAVRRLTAVRQQLVEVLSGAATDRVVLLSHYPPLVSEGDRCEGLDAADVANLHRGSKMLNGFLDEVAAIVGSGNVVVVPQPGFEDHGMCDQEPWFHPFDSPLGLHPNTSGYYSMAVNAADTLDRVGP